MLSNILQTPRVKWITAFLLPIGIFLILFPDYIVRHSFFWVCLATFPVSIITDKSNKFSFFGLCLCCGVLTLFLPTTIGIYVYICSMLLFLGQRMVGGLHVIGIVHAFLASPFFTYISSLISFPIRLQLSLAVSHMLSWSGIENTVEGNVIHLAHHSFMVDGACAGMYLLGYGILFGTIILSLRIRHATIKWYWLILYYSILLGLIIWGNLVRIYLLVVFNIGPDLWMHDAVGLLIYTMQILLPFYLLVKIGTTKSIMSSDVQSLQQFPLRKYIFLFVLLLPMTLRVYEKKSHHKTGHINIHLEGFESEVVKPDVVKLYNEDALMYLKSPVPAYSASHNPMVCWSGSGYVFHKIEKIKTRALEVNIAELKKGEDRLYTAWWFESTKSKTGDHLDWRLRSLKNGEQFYLVNLTCNTRSELLHEIKKLESILLIPLKTS